MAVVDGILIGAEEGRSREGGILVHQGVARPSPRETLRTGNAAGRPRHSADGHDLRLHQHLP